MRIVYHTWGRLAKYCGGSDENGRKGHVRVTDALCCEGLGEGCTGGAVRLISNPTWSSSTTTSGALRPAGQALLRLDGWTAYTVSPEEKPLTETVVAKKKRSARGKRKATR